MTKLIHYRGLSSPKALPTEPQNLRKRKRKIEREKEDRKKRRREERDSIVCFYVRDRL
jgi:hypothetical protein